MAKYLGQTKLLEILEIEVYKIYDVKNDVTPLQSNTLDLCLHNAFLVHLFIEQTFLSKATNK